MIDISSTHSFFAEFFNGQTWSRLNVKIMIRKTELTLIYKEKVVFSKLLKDIIDITNDTDKIPINGPLKRPLTKEIIYFKFRSKEELIVWSPYLKRKEEAKELASIYLVIEKSVKEI